MHLEIPYRKYSGGYWLPTLWFIFSLFWFYQLLFNNKTYAIAWVFTCFLNVYVHGKRHYWYLNKSFLTLNRNDLVYQDGPFSKLNRISCESVSDIQINTHRIRIETTDYDTYNIYPHAVDKEIYEELKKQIPLIINNKESEDLI